ncbi:hypothetical protein KCU93_g9102, partial [Aureobasidium melanogenum]
MTEEEDLNRTQKRIIVASHDEEASVSGEDEASEIMDPWAIKGVRRNENDDDNELYYEPADMWLPSADIPPELRRAWAKSQKSQIRRSSSLPSSPGSEYEIDDVKKDLALGFMLRFKKMGSKRVKWVPVREVSPAETHAWAKAEEKELEDKIKDLKKGKKSSLLQNRLALLVDLLEGEITEPTKPHWVSKTPSPDPDLPHAIFYSLPTTTRGYCDNAEHPPEALNHSTLVAACQSAKHVSNTDNTNASRHLVCTNCHDNPPIHRLTQDEQDHIIRDKGLFPLCLSCAEWWCDRYGMSSEEDGTTCTCKERLPQWLCADCWVEFAKVRSRGRDDCEEYRCAKTKKDEDRKKGDDAISKTVRMCSGCQGLVVKHDDRDEDEDEDDYDDNDDDEDSMSTPSDGTQEDR